MPTVPIVDPDRSAVESSTYDRLPCSKHRAMLADDLTYFGVAVDDKTRYQSGMKETIDPSTLKTLSLIGVRGRNLTDLGHTAFNRGIGDAIRRGFVTYAARDPSGYRLTALGRSALSQHLQ